MKIKALPIIAATVLLASAVSCRQEEFYPEPKGVEMTFLATHTDEPDTKTVLGEGGSVLWSPSDEVSIFCGSGSGGGSKFTSQNSEPAATVEFKGFLEGIGVPAAGQYYWAFSPYSGDNSCDGQGISATLPSEQIAVRGSFGKNCHPAIARSTGTGLAFYSVAGGLAFTVSRPGVRSVSIKGNNGEALAGTYKATFGSDGRPVVEVKSAKQEVTLTAPDGSAFIPGETYVISILPVQLSRGITITLVTDDNKKGTLVSRNPQTVKRSVFGRIPDLDQKISEWTDIPVSTEGGGTRTGLYLGIIGFNQQLYKMGIEQLNAESKPRFDSFVSGLTSKNGTLLYYSVDDAIRTLQKAQYPSDLFNVSLITFTDGLDQGSSMMIDNYPGDSEYLGILHNRLASSSVAGLPLTSYSVGLKGNDVTDVSMFRSNLRQLSYPESNAYEVSDMSSVNSRFQEIANQVNQKLTSTKYTLGLTIPGQANGTRMRFTLDGASSATGSSMYIEGVFNLSTKSLTDVTYHGLTCSSGSTVAGKVSGIFVSFTFADIVPLVGGNLYQSRISHWLYIPSSGAWQKNSEFSAANNVNVTVTKIKKSAVVLLNLDCSKSLGSQFSTLQSHAQSFIAKLYEAAYDPTEVSGVSLDKTEATINVGNTLTLNATVTPSTASNKNVIWSSSDTVVATVSNTGVVTGVGPGTATIAATTVEGGYTASCDVAVLQKVESIELDRTELEMFIGGTPITLAATVLPENSSDKSVSWTSSKSSIATVDSDGKVSAVSEGSTIITVRANDGSNVSATCMVTVKYNLSLPASVEAVDLGLPSGLKWATCNVGASNPEEYGAYFAWGETEPKTTYNWSTYKWCNGRYDSLTKYNKNSSYGAVDKKTVLDPEDDAAHVNWGGAWRMPTDEEWTELRENCTWTWTDNYNGTGVAGRIVTSNKAGYTNKSIFLPAAGYRGDSDLDYAGFWGYYWSSFLSSDIYAFYVRFGFGKVDREGHYRFYGQSVRPVDGESIPVESISLNKITLDLYRGEVGQLTATISPSNATNKDVHWVSSDESVATVSEIGLVRAIAPGTATITAYASNGVSTACMVTVNKMDLSLPDAVDAVDLGLPSGLKWATMNVGATRPEQYGEWFAWGETEPKWDYDWSTYKFELGTDYNGPLSKYVIDSSYGTVDNKTVLDLEDDSARVNWGGSWRMPTDTEWAELINNCTWTWTSNYNGTGVAGRIVTGNKTGYTDKSIFLPAAGYWRDSGLLNAESYGNYLSSSPVTDYPKDYGRCASGVYFNYDRVGMSIYSRWYGQSVRPVTE